MTAQEVIECILCGGRGGWWTRDKRTPCSRCDGTGWEPSEVIARLLADEGGTP